MPSSFPTSQDLTKGRSGGNVNKLYHDETKMSARQWKRESYANIQKHLKKDFGQSCPT